MDTLREVALVGPGISAIVAALAFVVGVLTLAKAIVEYVRQNALKRLEKFQEMKRKAETTEGFSKICILLLEDDHEILKVERNVKEAFLSFYEEIALIHNSDLSARRLPTTCSDIMQFDVMKIKIFGKAWIEKQNIGGCLSVS